MTTRSRTRTSRKAPTPPPVSTDSALPGEAPALDVALTGELTPVAPADRAPAQAGGRTREALIAEAAYLRAAQRSFTPGNELGDWLAAEREIDALLNEDAART